MQPIATGIKAVPGTASGQAVFSPLRVQKYAANNIILVCRETSPDDICAMNQAAGIVTLTGGKTSHAAVIARGWGKPCVVGCESLQVSGNKMMAGNVTIQEGEWITIKDGEVFEGKMDVDQHNPDLNDFLDCFLSNCDGNRKIGVRANVDTPIDAVKAFSIGAEGIGLVRTEHMFFRSTSRRLAIQRFIIGDDSALKEIENFQREDFIGLFGVANGKPVTIRLIDPPLHEFLPRTSNAIQSLSSASNLPVVAIRNKIEALRETNPMLGHRGCRLAVTCPKILDCQVRAIADAMIELETDGIEVNVEIMVPFVIDPKEFKMLADRIRMVMNQKFDAEGIEGNLRDSYLVGTMIETPRAALLAGKLAKVADFFSFGTNDLTQMTMGLSRDDAGRFLPVYEGFFSDPFESIDKEGVGMLVRSATQKARHANPDIKIGVCGEHGGDAKSIEFFASIGIDYVSCSTFRIPAARFAGARIGMKKKK